MITDCKLLLSVSLLLFAVYIYFYKEIKIPKLVKFILSFGFFISILFYILYGIGNYFTDKDTTSVIIYYINYGLSGANFSEYTKLISTSIFFIFVGVFFSIKIFFKKTSKSNKKTTKIYFILLPLFLSLFFNPVTASLKELILNSNRKLNEDLEFYKYYQIPKINQVKKTKNIIFIYAEGLERTYFDETIFPDLIKNLKKIESESISFINISQDKYSSTTITGMISSQCGSPSVTYFPNNMYGMNAYMKSAICLGDLLSRENYYLSYYGGADLDFASKGKFYLTHKFNDINGKNELLPKLEDPDYKTGWGLYDDSLFNLAYDNFLVLSKEQEKFAIFLLTLDTHHPNGNPSKSCDHIIYKDGSNSALNAVACSDYLISKFINKIRQSDYSDNTVIVLVSDHLSLKNTATYLLEKGDRRNLFLINTPDSKEDIKINKAGLTLDIGSTILPFIGYEGEIGLGRNILNLEDPDYRKKDLLANLDDLRPHLLKFWNFPKIEGFIKIDIEQKKIAINEEYFSFPILINIDDKLETELIFDFPMPDKPEFKSLISNLKKNEYFLYIQNCKKIETMLDDPINYPGFCLMIIKKDRYAYAKLTSNIEISTTELYKIIKNFPPKIEFSF